MRKARYILILLATALACITSQGVLAAGNMLPDNEGKATVGERHTRFFNLVADEVAIDSVLPSVSYVMPLPANYADSIYTASIIYPEFMTMGTMDVEAYKRVAGDAELPEMPAVEQTVVVDRRNASLLFSTTPLAFRDGEYKFLVSYMLKVESVAKKDVSANEDNAIANGQTSRSKAARVEGNAAQRYAEHSVLNSGRWAKIRVAQTGIHELTPEVVKQAGFSDINKVHIYGYGGALQPEKLSADYLISTDDLQEVETCVSNGRRLFYGKGPVSWKSNSTYTRTRNPYSDYGYYFITESDEAPAMVGAEAFLDDVYPSAEDYHTLYEVDNYAVYNGGRNLIEGAVIKPGDTRKLTITSKKESSGQITIVLASLVKSGQPTTVTCELNDSLLGKMTIAWSEYYKAKEATKTFNVKGFQTSNELKLTVSSGCETYVDYVATTTLKPRTMPDITTEVFPKAEYVYNITNQDHHADPQADMVIIIPTSQKTLAQAQRLADMHRTRDNMTVNIVPADELYNEFSSGTPDATAYKRYLKMLYDRSESLGTMPRHLLLFGDGVWDNRLLTANCRKLNADDMLLCYESENSYSEVSCFVADDFYTLMDDDEILGTEGSGTSFVSQRDVAVGRFPVTTAYEAKCIVDKCISYADGANNDKWQNTIVFMGDDGDTNRHMTDVNATAEEVMVNYPGYNVKKIMWDSFTRVSTSTGNGYPDVTALIKAHQAEGALIMDYAGHGGPALLSHEQVLKLSDFAMFQNKNLPIWVTASCDVMPFDGTAATIGETALLNPKGGAIAFLGTTRTVYATTNKYINSAFMNFALADDENGEPMTIGEACRLAKNYVSLGSDKSTNKIHYTLVGDPALRINRPSARCVVDSMMVNGEMFTNDDRAHVKAGSQVTLYGHLMTNHTKENAYTQKMGLDYSGISGPTKIEGKDGTINIYMRDSKELITCFNNAKETKKVKVSEKEYVEVPIDPFQFYDRRKVLFNGTDSLRNGAFNVSFVVPLDINYSDDSGLLTLYAVTNDKTIKANGEDDNFDVGGSVDMNNDNIGPSIYCYLNSPSFVNGGTVNTTPFFYAEITDKDGINTSGSGIGHDLQLSIDNDKAMTFSLNDNFQFDFGTYASGSTFYSLPALTEGFHKLTFRAWDILNNPSTAELTFFVEKGVAPLLNDINVTKNPARTSTTFVIQHDHVGSRLDMCIDIMDMSGRLLYTITDHATPQSGTYTLDWDLRTDSGSRLQTGVYLYRVRLSSEGSGTASKAKKLIVISE